MPLPRRLLCQRLAVVLRAGDGQGWNLLLEVPMPKGGRTTKGIIVVGSYHQALSISIYTIYIYIYICICMFMCVYMYMHV